jgi:raffinose/stachyose/melibiose transport system permease protein
MISRREVWASHAALVVFALAALLPVLGVIVLALEPGDPSSSSLTLSHGLTFSNFVAAWHIGNGFGGYLVTSAIVAVVSVAGATVLSVLAGYAFGTMEFRGRKLLLGMLLLGLIVPLEASVVPLFYDLRTLGVSGSVWSLIIPQIALQMPFGILWMRAFFRSVPRSLIDAAEIDRAGSLTILVRVLLPIARPAILTMVALTFVWIWNDFFLSLIMLAGSDTLQTAPLALGLFTNPTLGFNDIRGEAAAAVIVATAPTLVYLFLQRHFMRGVLTGALVE